MATQGIRPPVLILLALLAAIGLAAWAFRDDLMSTALDPKTPFQTYRPPPPPDYGMSSAWALRPARPASSADPAADVFFISPTTYAGGRHWNGPIDEPAANRRFRRVAAPNYVGPFVGVGRVFAPRYRQAGLYSLTTLREDAREARRFAYGDVQAAFRAFVAATAGRPILIVGVEQGGTLGLRLLTEEVARAPELQRRLVAAYLIDTAVPADRPPAPPCARRRQSGCLAAWVRVEAGDRLAGERLLRRALVWTPDGTLTNIGPRPVLCFNPILGATSDRPAPARLHLGGASATGLEWGARPAFLARQVAARCEGGVLHVTRPRSSALRPGGSWAERRMAPGFNLFYADLEADAQARLADWLATPRP